MQPIARMIALVVLVFAGCSVSSTPQTTLAQSPQLAGCPILPADNVWNTPVDALPVDSNSTAYINNVGSNGYLHADFGSGQYGEYGIPYVVVPNGQPRVNVTFDYDDESDPGPYPIPPDAPIEGGSDADGDRHVLVLEEGSCMLYELYSAYPNTDGSWDAGSGAIFDLRSNALRPDGWTSADAAGLPILPGLIRYEEVAAGEINHAIRFTVPCTADAYIWPARHKAVPDSCPGTPPAGTLAPPMGLRLRLKADFDISGFSHDTQVILRALKKYGMIVADNGSAWYLSGTSNPAWDDDTLVDELRQVHGSAFEVVDESSLQVSPDSGQVISQLRDTKRVTPASAEQGQQVAYTIEIAGDGTPITLSDPLPAGLTMVGDPTTEPASLPDAVYNGATRTITWSGAPETATLVTISYSVTLDSAATQAIVNSAGLTRGASQTTLQAVLIANPAQSFLPVVRR